MAKVKYHTGITPLVNEHFGFTFQAHASGQSITTSKKNDRFRNVNQSARQQNLMRAIRNWRNMSAATKNAWSVFALAFPQASRRNPAIFLTGYQLFLKRSHYLFLNFEIDAEFMSEPVMVSLPDPIITFSVTQSENCIDVTELYLAAFGLLPVVGSYVLLRAFVMARDSGQFFETIQQVIRVDEVFLDGLFVSIHFAAAVPVVSISLYLSKVNYQSAIYIGTKVKYMGCFSPKTFLELTDTPDSYVGQSEKIVSVKADETGLEFTEGGGGGIDCDDLLDCSIIQQMIAQIEANSIIISSEFNTSVPPVVYGLLYNFSIVEFENIRPVLAAGWHHMSDSDVAVLIAEAGGSVVGGAALKETGLVHWASPNTGSTNILNFSGRGSGSRGWGGTFQNFGTKHQWWYSYFTGTYARSKFLRNSDILIGQVNANKGYGFSLRAVKDLTTLPDGSSGVYIGNNKRVYRTIVIGGLEFLADNLCETRYRDATSIQELTDGAAFFADRIGALCAYDNDWDNV